MQITDEICTVCNEYYEVGDTIDPNEMEHHEFGLCKECFDSGETILCDIYLANGSSKEILGEDYLIHEPLGEHLFGPAKNPDQFGAYLHQMYGDVDLVVFPVRGEIVKYSDNSKVKQLLEKGYVVLKGSK